MEVLVYLANHADEVVLKERLLQAVWPDTFVGDAVVTHAISELRKAFGDSAEKPHVIQTIPRKGYRLIASVRSSVVSERSPFIRKHWLICGVLLAVVTLAFVSWLLLRPLSRPEAVRIAVLPLSLVESDERAGYIAKGVTIELISLLSQIPDLGVIAYRSVAAYEKTDKSIFQIAQELGVEGVVDGTVRKSNGTIRISVQLVDAETEENLWSADYDRELSGVLELEREIAERVVEALKFEWFDRRAVMVGADNLQAYDLYLKGLSHWKPGDAAELATAIAYFKQAIESDPELGPAYAWLSYCYMLLGDMGQLPPTEAYPTARDFARKALELDENLAEALTSQAYAKLYYQWDWPEAERDFKRAIELSPGSASPLFWYGSALSNTAQTDAAIEQLKEAQNLDPRSADVATALGAAIEQTGDEESTLQVYEKAVQLDPYFFPVQMALGQFHMKRAEYSEALQSYRRAVRYSTNHPSTVAALGTTLALLGMEEEAREQLDALRNRAKEEYVPAISLASLYTALGDEAEARNWLERAYDERSWWAFVVASNFSLPTYGEYLIGGTGPFFVVSQPALASRLGDGEVRGVVRDQSLTVIPGADVSLFNRLSRAIKTTTTDQIGSYKFEGVPEGSYSLWIEMHGFHIWRRDFRVAVRSTVTIDAELQVGDIFEVIE
jgi:TolB-like protein/Flp pilus assembly protein TadD